MIVNDHAAVYVSTTAIYLYKENYNSSSITSITEIAKFSMKQGILDAVGAANVPGTVRDTFAVHEYQGRLRILTTSQGSEGSENNLYLFDENLESVGKLEALAQGEQIYSARFLGTMAYFVTYRNMDPLFAVDLSDEKNPNTSDIAWSNIGESTLMTCFTWPARPRLLPMTERMGIGVCRC